MAGIFRDFIRALPIGPSANQQQTPYPAPLSPSAGGHEPRDDYLAQDATQPSKQKEPYLTPYLGLRARLSQTWINRWSILLLLVLFRAIFAVSGVDNDIASARREALSACTAVESVGSTLASMPYYMSSGVNRLVADGIDDAIDGLRDLLQLILTGVEEIIVYVINMMTSTYLCLITLAVSGALDVALEVADYVGGALNDTAHAVGKSLGGAETDFQDAMNDFLKGLSDIANWISDKNKTAPSINLTGEIDTLDSMQLPANYDMGLEKLNSSIPTFDGVKNLTDSVIEAPFNEVKKLLNETWPNYSMNVTIFPVPAKEHLTFCSGNDSIDKFFDDLVDIANLARTIFYVVLIVLIVGTWAPMAYREIRSWATMKCRALMIKSNEHHPMDAVYLVSRPYTASAGLWLSKKFKSPRRQAVVRWTVAYGTTQPALFVLSLALASILACLCQYILLKVIAKEVPVIENEVIGFADKVIDSLNNSTEKWTNDINGIMNDTSTKLNHDLFGWVNTTTGAVNDTLNVFVNDTMEVLNKTFGGTVLYTPILDVMNCLILMKIAGIEKGLTWVSDHAHIDFPQISNDTFTLDTISKVNESSASVLSTGSDSSVADDLTAAVEWLINSLQKVVRQEGIIALCLLLIWFLIVLIGLLRAVYILYSGKGQLEPDDALQSTELSNEKPGADEYMTSAAPSYEQATSTAGPETVRTNQVKGPSYTLTPDLEAGSADQFRSQSYAMYTQPGNNAANQYKGQSYTLTPNPMPALNLNTSTSPIMAATASATDEKVGTVNGQNVDSAIRRPTHFRASSHGDYDVTSPIVPPSRNPFLSVNPKRDPFADPRR